MKKGFTLIELLAVVAIIGILMAIAVPMVSKTLNEMKQNLFDAQIANIVEGTKSWTADNITLMPLINDESITITLSQLKLGGYIDVDLENPLTNEPFPDDMQILITRKNNEYTYLVMTETGGTIQAFSGDIPFAFVYGRGVQPINLNGTYSEKGIYAKYNGAVVTDYDIIIKKDNAVVPSIDTSTNGTYKVIYSISYNNKTVELVRDVVIGDTEPPVITYPITPIINVADVATFDSMLGVSATDNSGEAITVQASGNLSSIPGTYQITYTASDSAGNVRSSIRTIEVIAPEWTFQVEVTAGSLNFAFATTTANIEILWGDGATTNFNGTGYPTHNYASQGTYNITLKGNASRIAFCDAGDSSPCTNTTPEKLKDIITAIPIELGLTDASGMFKNTLVTNFSKVDFFDEASANITNMYAMFRNSVNFNHPIGNWNTSNVVNTSVMFNGCTAFNQPILNWNTSNVVDMSAMFMLAKAYNQPVGNWNTSKVTEMDLMFYDADAFNQPLSIWDTSNVTNMSMMFYEANAFNQALGTWNTAKVTNMSLMFSFARAFNQNINVWNVSNVTNMSAMFNFALLFNQNISTWNVSKVTNMSGMFSYAPVFNQNLSSWCVSLIPTLPTDFSTGATAWALAKPIWGTCP